VPIYPLFIGVLRDFVGEEYYRVAVVSVQLILHLLATLLVARICELIGFRRASLICAYLYGLNPLMLSFVMLPITEGLSTSLITFFIFLSVRAVKSCCARAFFYAGMMSSIAILVSPRNGVILLFLSPFFLSYFRNAGVSRSIVSSALCFLLGIVLVITPWTVRNWMNISELVPLERYYGHHAFGDEGPKNFGLFEWWQAWGDAKGIELHQLIMHVPGNNFESQLGFWIDKHVPTWVLEINGKQRLLKTFAAYKDCGFEVKEKLSGLPRFKRQDQEPKCENQVRDQFLSFRAELSDAAPFRVYVVSVIQRLRLYAFQSTVHAWGRVAGQQNIFDFAIKSYGFILNSLNFLAIVLVLVYNQLRVRLLPFILPVVFLLLFILYARHVEARYLIQIYPFTAVLLAIVIAYIPSMSNRLLSRFQASSS